jgi:hypothetical protein
MDEGVQLLELARNAQKLFERREPREKRRLLSFVLSNCTWEDGEVVASLCQPFDLLAETAIRAAHVAAGDRAKTVKSEILTMQCGSHLSAGPNSLLSGNFAGNFLKKAALVGF